MMLNTIRHGFNDDNAHGAPDTDAADENANPNVARAT